MTVRKGLSLSFCRFLCKPQTLVLFLFSIIVFFLTFLLKHYYDLPFYLVEIKNIDFFLVAFARKLKFGWHNRWDYFIRCQWNIFVKLFATSKFRVVDYQNTERNYIWFGMIIVNGVFCYCCCINVFNSMRTPAKKTRLFYLAFVRMFWWKVSLLILPSTEYNVLSTICLPYKTKLVILWKYFWKLFLNPLWE